MGDMVTRPPRLSVLLLVAWLAFASTAAAVVPSGAGLRHALGVLERGDARVNAAFVAAAIGVMSDRFLAAAERSDDPGWASGTRAYVASLERAAVAARAGGPVRVLEDPDGSLRIVVGAGPVHQFMLSAPAPGQRAALERDVLARWCDAVPCMAVAAVPPAPARTLPARTTAALPAGDDGLGCVLGDRHATLRRRACAALMAEIRRLATALHDHARAGRSLDFAVLAEARWREPGRVLTVAANGEVLVVEAPLLGRYPAQLAAAAPWIRARLQGTVQRHLLDPPAPLVYAAPPPAAGARR